MQSACRLFAGGRPDREGGRNNAAGSGRRRGGDNERRRIYDRMRDHQCANTHCIAFADKFKEIVEGKGDKAMVLAANDDPETLLQCIDDLVAAGVDGIVMESPNATAPVEALREAAEKGIVISAADVLLDIEESEGVLVSQTVSDNYGAGVLCANDLIERLDGKEGTVCHIIYPRNVNLQ